MEGRNLCGLGGGFGLGGRRNASEVNICDCWPCALQTRHFCEFLQSVARCLGDPHQICV